jgi:hypothetical protein
LRGAGLDSRQSNFRANVFAGMNDADDERGIARLDEKSARRIAAGRLDAFQERVDAVLLGSRLTSSLKPDVRARAIQDTLQQAFGAWFLVSGRIGRNLVFGIAQRGEKPGWVEVLTVHHDLRSAATEVYELAQLSAHATARLLERRRDVDIERLLAEELRGVPFLQLVEAQIGNKSDDIRLATANGEFRFSRDEEEGTLVAVTWVAAKPA